MKNIQAILEKLPITKGANAACVKAAALVCMPIFCDYERDQVILSPGQQSNALYVLCNGSAAAYSSDTDKQVLLRSFKPYEIFGVSNLFTEHDFVTRIVAKTPCRVLVLSKAFLTHLIDNDATVRYQYIGFIAQKTLFLNQKITCLTAGCAENRLAVWLNANAGDEQVTLDIPMNALCTMLDIGRASLYRAFDKLEADGFIKRDNKIVYLLDREHMLHFYKGKESSL